MRVPFGVENNNDGRSIAWALENPGCYAYGGNADEAQANMQAALQDYKAWVQAHGMSWMNAASLDPYVEETFRAYQVPRPSISGEDPNSTYMVESFFQLEQQPLSGMDVERALKLLEWSRLDLLAVLDGLSAEQLQRSHPGERWNIAGVLKHVAGAEWWYQERIGSPFPRREADLPDEPLERLELVRAHFRALLPRLDGVRLVLEKDREVWSPRKVLRRALWHERDHTEHIRKLL